jgi:hypothetical protein
MEFLDNTLITGLSISGFYRKSYSSLVVKIYKKSAKQENFRVFLLNSIFKNEKIRIEKQDKKLSQSLGTESLIKKGRPRIPSLNTHTPG